MSTKRAFWGDLRLWWAGRGYVENVRRGTRQKHHGIDRLEALPIGSSPNFESEVEISTFFAPTTSFDQTSFRAYVAAMIDALTARAGIASGTHPLIWVARNDLASTLSSGATAPYQTAFAHGLVPGDRVLIRTLTPGAYLYGEILTTPGSQTFTVSSIAQGTAYVPANGYDVVLVERAWPGQIFDAMTPLPSEGAGTPGDYYAPRASFRFFGPRQGVYTRSSVDLDA